MKKPTIHILVCLFIIFAFRRGTLADDITPFQFGLFTPIQLFSEDYQVWGLRLGLVYTANKSVYGFDVTPGISHVKESLGGIQVSGIVGMGRNVVGLQLAGVAGFYFESFTGIQVSGISNLDGFFIHGDNSGRGIQIAGGYNSISNWAGFQAAGLCNRISGDFVGIQMSPGINYCSFEVFSDSRTSYRSWMYGLQLAGGWNRGDVVCGVQVGLINSAGRVAGLQIGLINYARQMSGVQIGLINIIAQGPLPFFPIFNASLSF